MTLPQPITDSQDEQTLDEFFREADLIQIPLFQRQYIWSQREFLELQKDIEQVKEDIDSSQFLGAIVSYLNSRQAGSVFGRLKKISIVDGQQRILTLYIYIIAIVEILAKNGNKEDALDIVKNHILIQSRRGLDVNTRIIPSYADSAQFRIILDRISTPEILQEELEDTRILPPRPSGNSNGRLLTQYNRIRRYLQNEVDKEPERGNEFLTNIFEIVFNKLTFVHLMLNDASVAPKIFERLNYRGIPIGTIDLVRNEVFSSLMDHPTDAERIYHFTWKPYVDNFHGTENGFFFPYCLIHNSSTKKSELFTELRNIWNGKTPEQIIEHMTTYQDPYNAIDSTGKFLENQEISKRLDRLVRMKRPSSIYPFVMSLLIAYQNHDISESQCTDLLDVIESFLVRRAIIGYEPTGLHALFKGLWQELDDKNIQSFIQAVSDRPTIQWPNDEEFMEAVKNRPLAKTRICNYLLVEFDKDLPGDNPNSLPTIEHILPNSYNSENEWGEIFSIEDHRELKDIWANLVPLSVPLNSSLQVSPYSRKRERYLAESMFKTPRNLATDYDTWTVEDIRNRANRISEWALNQWPYNFGYVV